MRTYTQLTQEQRYQISALKRIDLSQSKMAEEIGVHRATLSGWQNLDTETGQVKV